MNRILWRGSAQLDRRSMATPSAEQMAMVNRFTASAAAAPEDVYVCSAMACNDIVDHYSTRFTARALEQIAALLPGSNLMRNHQEYGTEDLPIGRVFAAELVTEGDAQWVRAWLYWERGTSEGDAMAKRISLGIWREVSLSWWMRLFTCSVTGKPFDESPGMWPGLVLPDGQTVVGIMDDVTEVNELSIVPRGGQKGTSIGDVRGADDEDVRNRVLAMRAKASGPDIEAGQRFARYFGRPKRKAMSELIERYKLRQESK